MADNGWLTLAWPKEYGGRGASHFQQLIFMEECSISKSFGTELQQHSARRSVNMFGLCGLLAKGESWAPLGGEYSHLYLSTVSATIAGAPAR